MPLPAPVVYPDSDGHFLPANRPQARHRQSAQLLRLSLHTRRQWRRGRRHVHLLSRRRPQRQCRTGPVRGARSRSGRAHGLQVVGGGQGAGLRGGSGLPLERGTRRAQETRPVREVGVRRVLPVPAGSESPGAASEGLLAARGTDEPIRPEPREPGGWYSSPALGVQLRAEGTNLRVRAARTGEEYAWTRELRLKFESMRELVAAGLSGQKLRFGWRNRKLGCVRPRRSVLSLVDFPRVGLALATGTSHRQLTIQDLVAVLVLKLRLG